MARGEVVRAVEHDIDIGEQRSKILLVDALLQGKNSDIGIQGRKRCLRRCHLLRADGIGTVKNLALQVGKVDLVRIGERELADAAGGEIERRRAAEAARADDERMRVAQPLLALDADLGEQDVAAVAEELLVVQAGSVGADAGGRISSISPQAWSPRSTARS